jgi:uncharacterized pyridoxal phosphate-containing UPF0001 family protein
LEERLGQVRRRIASAAERTGRDPSSVEILPVTKGHASDAIRLVAEVGLGRIGENRVAEAEGKLAVLKGSAGLTWHLIGHLQRNKVRRAIAVFDTIESVDSIRLATRLSHVAQTEARTDLEVFSHRTRTCYARPFVESGGWPSGALRTSKASSHACSRWG